MSTPFFSIITISYNIKDCISDTLRSVQEQGFVDYEHILIDGNSTDGTLNILQSYSREKDNVKLISEKDSGIYDAMNKGLKNASGEYIIFINGGDGISGKEVLSQLFDQINICDFPNFIYTDTYIKGDDGKLNYKKARHHTYKWYGMFSNHQSMIYKRTIIEAYKLQYDTSYKIAADYKFTLEFLAKSEDKIFKLNIPSSYFSLGGVSDLERVNGLNEAQKARSEVLKYTKFQNLLIRYLLKMVQFVYNYFQPVYKKIRYSK